MTRKLSDSNYVTVNIWFSLCVFVTFDVIEPFIKLVTKFKDMLSYIAKELCVTRKHEVKMIQKYKISAKSRNSSVAK